MANKNLSDLKNIHRRISLNIVHAYTCVYVLAYIIVLISITSTRKVEALSKIILRLKYMAYYGFSKEFTL